MSRSTSSFTTILHFASSLPVLADAARTVQELFSALQTIILKYRRWERSMDASLLRGDGLQALLDASEEVLRNHVDIVDPAMKPLAYTKGNEVEDPITNRLEERRQVQASVN